jgi:hypothetical protein
MASFSLLRFDFKFGSSYAFMEWYFGQSTSDSGNSILSPRFTKSFAISGLMLQMSTEQSGEVGKAILSTSAATT